MKTVGIIGGIGPESTIEYYRRLLTSHRVQTGEESAPSVIINSVDNRKVLGLIAAEEFSALLDYLGAELDRLYRAGAGVALVAANTPHIVFDELSLRSSIPLIDIVEATCTAAQAAGLRRVALFGTRFTMEGSFYSKKFSDWGIQLVVPDAIEQAYIHDKYMTELLRGVILPETRQHLLSIAAAMKRRDAIDGLILGGTELSLIFREPTVVGLPVLDTTQIHVEAALAWLLSA